MQLRFKPCFVPLAGLLISGFLAQNASAQSARNVPGELLVRWKSQRAPLVLAPSTNPARWQQSGLSSQISARLPGSKLKKTFAMSGWSLIKIPAGESTETARAALIKSLGEANVTLNFRRYATKVPNDPSYGEQWQWPKIKAPDAWNAGVGSRDVVVAVLDSGIDLNHADLQDNLWKNPGEIPGNRIDDDGNGYIDDVYGLNGINPSAPPQDGEGHGTFCAGLVGAVGNNGNGISGVNWNVKIMALQFLDSTGSGADADAITCFEYAIKMKQRGVNLRVISNSYAGPDDNPAFKEAYVAAINAGILQVSAASNDGIDNDIAPQYPASYGGSNSIAVAATDQNDALASFSNHGARSVDLAAPGVSVTSLLLGGGITRMSGTSMATPIVAGAAALISSLEPGLSASALKARILKTVDPVAALSGKVVSGGRLNLARAVRPISYGLSGQVYRLDGATRVPLPGATVTLGGQANTSTVTDTSGKYSFGNLAAGTYGLTIKLQGYTFEVKRIAFPLASGATGGVVDFAAQSAPSTFYMLYGTARDAAGVPVRGVSIALSSAPTVVVATTNSLGQYRIPNRPAGTYTLKATSSSYRWTATPGSIAIPQSAINGRAEINLKGVLIDKTAPAITITAPASGGTFAPGNQVALGKATDASGNKEVFFELTRFVNFVPSYYNWTNRLWDATRSSATTLTRPLTGKIANWSMTLPGMAPANYSLRVWGRDVLGNISRGEADAFSSFSVVKSTTSSLSSAGSS